MSPPPKPHELCPEIIEAGQKIASIEATMIAIDDRERRAADILTEVRTDVKTLLAHRAAGSGAMSLLRSLVPWIAVVVAVLAVMLR